MPEFSSPIFLADANRENAATARLEALTEILVSLRKRLRNRLTGAGYSTHIRPRQSFEGGRKIHSDVTLRGQDLLLRSGSPGSQRRLVGARGPRLPLRRQDRKDVV